MDAIETIGLGGRISLRDDAETTAALDQPAVAFAHDRALALAARMFAEANVLKGDVVLVTDGDNLSPEAFQAARDLAGRGIHVDAYLVRPSAENGDLPPPDEASLQRLTEAGDGSFGEASDPFALADAVGRRSASELAKGYTAALFFADFGRYLLVLALFPALLLFRKAN